MYQAKTTNIAPFLVLNKRFIFKMRYMDAQILKKKLFFRFSLTFIKSSGNCMYSLQNEGKLFLCEARTTFYERHELQFYIWLFINAGLQSLTICFEQNLYHSEFRHDPENPHTPLSACLHHIGSPTSQNLCSRRDTMSRAQNVSRNVWGSKGSEEYNCCLLGYDTV